mmetsp:Transcript_11645/g.27350  ORF Transcript_11645/g.27350 Transcript_11645/m.27350 type:complete len:524 (+) Transcript_11645:129-1700(+)
MAKGRALKLTHHNKGEARTPQPEYRCSRKTAELAFEIHNAACPVPSQRPAPCSRACARSGGGEPALARQRLDREETPLHEVEPHEAHHHAAGADAVEARLGIGHALDGTLGREDEGAGPLAAQVGDGVEHGHVRAADLRVGHAVEEGHLRHEHGRACHAAHGDDADGDDVEPQRDGVAGRRVDPQDEDEQHGEHAVEEPRLEAREEDDQRRHGELAVGVAAEQLRHVGLRGHGDRQHDHRERGQVLLGHALGHELERRQGVEGGERRLDGEQHQRQRAHGRQLQHEPHLLVGLEQLRPRAALLRPVLVLLDEQHADRRGDEDPPPEEEEAAQRGHAVRAQAQEADVGEEVPQGLADGVARGAVLPVALREDREREAVDGDVLRRAEEVEGEEEGGQLVDVDAAPVAAEHRVHPEARREEQRADRELRRHDPSLAAAEGARVDRVDQRCPQELEREWVGHHREDRLLHAAHLLLDHQQREAGTEPHGNALQRVEQEQEHDGGPVALEALLRGLLVIARAALGLG